MTDKITEIIQTADLVLVGLGEEMDTRPAAMREEEPYAALLAQAEAAEDTQWLIPFLFSHYLRQQKDARRGRAYETLSRLLEGKNYYVVTTCTDGRVYEAGLDRARIVAPCGGYDRLQCTKECGHALQPAGELAERLMAECQADSGRLAKLTRPVCGACGATLCMNHIAEDYQEEGYLPQWEKYTGWLQETLHQNLCVLELGVGMQYPTVIRWPFEKAAFFNEKAKFIRVHSKLYQLSEELHEKGYSVACHPLEWLAAQESLLK